LSQEIRRSSKSLIHRILHHQSKEPAREIAVIKKLVDKVLLALRRNPDLYLVRSVAEGMEEYVELIFLECYRQNSNKILKYLPEDLDHEALIGGIADTSGELVRLARAKVDLAEAEKVHQYILELYEHFLDLEVSRNNKLRSKMEEVRRNMLRLEDTIFELKLKLPVK